MTLQYSPLPAARTTLNTAHDVVYASLLGAADLMTTLGFLSLMHIRRRIAPAPDQDAALLLVLRTEAAFIALATIVLAIRLFLPRHRRWPTLLFNILLLLGIPLGTILGIYGLWKVDKKLRTSDSASGVVGTSSP